MIVIADGSNDQSEKVVAQFPEVTYLHQSERKGKTAALNRAVPFITSDISIFTDANTMLTPDSIRLIANHFADPEIGGVSGEKMVLQTEGDAAGSGEGMYWKYESFLKKKDSQFYSVCGAPGELIAFRTALYPTLPEDTILDDFMLSMEVCSKGYRCIYEPNAVALEPPSLSMGDEWKRKVRICAGGFQSISRLGSKINPFKSFRLFYVYFSHRVMRWAVAPWCLIIAFALNSVLINESSLLCSLFMAQSFFYFMALLGYLLRSKKITIKGFFVPYYFVMMNLAAISGYFKFMMGKQSAIWEKAKR